MKSNAYQTLTNHIIVIMLYIFVKYFSFLENLTKMFIEQFSFLSILFAKGYIMNLQFI